MSGFININLQRFKRDIDENREFTEDGYRIRTCPKNTVGGSIEDFKKEQYRNDSICGRIPARARTSFAEHINRQSTGKEKQTFSQDDSLYNGENRLDRQCFQSMCKVGPLNDFRTKKQRENLVFDPEKFYKQDRFRTMGSTVNTSVIADSECDSNPVSFLNSSFVIRIQKWLLEHTKTMPPFVTRAMFRYSSYSNFVRIISRENFYALFEYESFKSKSELEEKICKGFYQIAQQTLDRYHQRIKLRRDLGRLSLEDMRVGNPHNQPVLEKPIFADCPIDYDFCDSEQQFLEDEIFNRSCDFFCNIIHKKLHQDATVERLKCDFDNPQAPGGLVGGRSVHIGVNKKCNRLVNSIQYDPRTEIPPSPFDPNQKQPFEFLLPKRERERIGKLLKKNSE